MKVICTTSFEIFEENVEYTIRKIYNIHNSDEFVSYYIHNPNDIDRGMYISEYYYNKHFEDFMKVRKEKLLKIKQRIHGNR
jgi:hypothetical protein